LYDFFYKIKSSDLIAIKMAMIYIGQPCSQQGQSNTQHADSGLLPAVRRENSSQKISRNSH